MDDATIHRKDGGFTLVELLVTLMIAGLLLASGLPSLADWLAGKRLQSTLYDLGRDAAHARRSAVLGMAPVVLCGDDGQGFCNTSGDLSRGWIVFVNADRDRPAQRDVSEPVLVRGAPAPGITLRANRQAFHFAHRGRRSTNGTIVACDFQERSAARRLVVSHSGRARVSQTRGRGCQ